MAVTHRMIEAFRAVVQSGSVTRAAGLLNVSQPSVSRLLADLEARLNLALFERRGARLTATNAALELYDVVERSFVGLERVQDAALQIRNRQSGGLTLATISAFGYTLLPEVLRSFSASPGAPPVRVHIVPSQQALSMLALRRCDLAFASIPPSADIGRQVAAFALKGRVILPEGHRLGQGAEALTPATLAEEPMIAVAAHSLPRAETDRAFAQHGVTPRIAIETLQSFSALQLVRAGLGFAVVDPMTSLMHEKAGGVSRAFLPEVDFSFSAYTWRVADEALWVQRFVDHAQEAVGALS
ncbi:LysR family transcriptional regulator [Acetobacteraceae bacterium H6797]|nr:LysR family transcriptional regulator [Acetobacteraceae bacterium H6797]